jgi:hypothetical protein
MFERRVVRLPPVPSHNAGAAGLRSFQDQEVPVGRMGASSHMRSRSAQLATVLLICSLGSASGQVQQPPGQTRPEISSEIDALIQLSPSQRRARLIGWSIAARLQKLGPPAAAALAASLRRDTWDDGHGNLSPVQEALAKMGDWLDEALRRRDSCCTNASIRPHILC